MFPPAKFKSPFYGGNTVKARCAFPSDWRMMDFSSVKKSRSVSSRCMEPSMLVLQESSASRVVRRTSRTSVPFFLVIRTPFSKPSRHTRDRYVVSASANDSAFRIHFQTRNAPDDELCRDSGDLLKEECSPVARIDPRE